MDTEIALPQTPACRILTVSPSLDHAFALIKLIQTHDGAASNPAPASSTQSSPSATSPRTIPWTISNKYYSADVHFSAHDVKDVTDRDAHGVPAILFVWTHGEPYRHHILRLAQEIGVSEAEVSLAIRIHPTEPHVEPLPDEEEDSEIDEFLSSHGFEFIDGTEHRSLGDSDDVLSEDIPRLPRLIDALSTIMWPTMQARTRTPRVGAASATAQRERELLDWAQEDDSLASTSIDDLVSPLRRADSSKLEREMKELVRWLETDESSRALAKEDPWNTAGDAAFSTSPTTLGPSPLGDVGQDSRGDGEGGFDDDFTVFVSAPAEMAKSPVRFALDDEQLLGHASFDSSFDMSFGSDSGLLGPAHAGASYNQLGSELGSDFGGDDAAANDARTQASAGDTADDGLPTDDEVRATSARIFGSAPPPLARSDTLRPAPSQPRQSGTSADLQPELEGLDDEGYDMAPFDLQRVLGALQGMKAEIAGIEDEEERRRAAARVALGLVYGLEGGPGQEAGL